MISVSFLGGVLFGVIIMLLITKTHIYELGEEIDKFRELYFSELDKWKNKYDNDDYEAY